MPEQFSGSLLRSLLRTSPDTQQLMEADEVGTVKALNAHREIMDGLIAQNRGRIANTAGDSILAEFPSAVDAVRCAIEAQRQFASNLDGTRLQFRIGVHVGDVIVQGGDLLGDGVIWRRAVIYC